MGLLGEQKVKWGEETSKKKIKTEKTVDVIVPEQPAAELTKIREQIELSIKQALTHAVQLYAIKPTTDLYSMIVDLELLLRNFYKI